MGSQSEAILKSFALNDNDKKDCNKVLQKFDEHFVPKRNVIFERCRFNKCVQQDGESVGTFVRNLYTLSEHCDFGDARNQYIRDRLVIGLLDGQVSERLQMKTDLTLDGAIETARHSELVKSQRNEIRSTSASADAIRVTQSQATPIVNARGRGSQSNRQNTRGGARPRQRQSQQKNPVASSRDEILDRIHDGHLGMTKCIQRANQSVWWPGLTKQIQTKVAQCSYCQINRPSLRKEPLKSTPLPSRPWQQLAADILEFKSKHYLLVIDYFSRYFELKHVPRLTSNVTILKMKEIFARFGTPEQLITDNGTNFVSREFREFQTAYCFQHMTVSPYHHHANGEVERAVATAKKILGQKDHFLGLMTYRSTPTQPTGCSPAELLMGRPLKTTLPILTENLTPRWPNFEKVRENDDRAKSLNERYFNDRHGVRELPELKPGDTVRVKLDNEKGWVTTGIVTDKLPTPRSYNIETSRGKYRRNRKHLKPAPGITYEMTPPEVDPLDDYMQGTPIVGNQPQANQHSGRKVTRSGRVVRPPKRYGFD
ncbi:uncharacterized protein LOC135464872 [Liolophura sinensis]|uniref:uncharacterized protein LOC135464872 n=1 Tax=Liolophura sinensis TaxID=3198878 RepID=UPI0031598F6D